MCRWGQCWRTRAWDPSSVRLVQAPRYVVHKPAATVTLSLFQRVSVSLSSIQRRVPGRVPGRGSEGAARRPAGPLGRGAARPGQARRPSRNSCPGRWLVAPAATHRVHSYHAEQIFHFKPRQFRRDGGLNHTRPTKSRAETRGVRLASVWRLHGVRMASASGHRKQKRAVKWLWREKLENEKRRSV